MSSVYIASDRGKLHRKNDTLVFNDDETTRTIFPYDTDQIVIIGACEITNPAIKLLLHHKINTIFLNKNGKYAGKLSGGEPKNIFLRKKQYLLTDDEEFRVKFSKQIAKAKLQNQLTFMQRVTRKLGLVEAKKAITKMKENIKNLETADNIDTVRGIEGFGAKTYFSIYKYAIDPEWAIFNGRSMNPPKDNVNAVLSFLYTLILYRVNNAILTKGLDPYAGFFHSLGYGKTTLAFDLMEEYRVPLGDSLCASIFNLGILKKEDFREVSFSKESDEYPLDKNSVDKVEGIASEVIVTDKIGVLLTQDGVKKVIQQFEKKLNTELFYPESGRKQDYKQIIFHQISKCKRVINGDQDKYEGLIIK